MKSLPTIMVLLISMQLAAQTPDFSAICKSEMKQLEYMVGDWKGEAIVQTRNGPITVNQTEHIEWRLDGVLLAIEGTGKQNNEVTFNAIAIVNYNPYSKQYQFRSYTKEGNSTDAYFKILEANKFEWGFDIPSGGKVKYTITLDPANKTWYELGHYSPDGKTWMKSIEMNLVKL
ncbi:MAG TPA: hypothetical protein DIS90_07160 [Cytophagales bacterium]|nr:hypothetical protein [Cytophagales bacterium]HCR53029.1 hypothetical protein [Cytophagales bacterium]